jgi:cell division septation protein DedD
MALSRGESETALLNYNILRERYRTAIGQEKLAAALQDVSESQTGKEASEVITGVTYSVQVGVFSEKDNARRMEERIKAYGYSTRIAKRTISGSTYHVVLAGEFPTMNDAQAARQKLERGENEVFKVVVNDEE